MIPESYGKEPSQVGTALLTQLIALSTPDWDPLGVKY